MGMSDNIHYIRPRTKNMKLDHLEHLVSPTSLCALQLSGEHTSGDDVQDGCLTAGDSQYLLRKGIPSFVPDAVLKTQTVRSFAQKWEKHTYYGEHTKLFYTQWYLDRYGFYEFANLEAFLEGRRFVLDAGTGTGRDAVNFATHSNATVFGVDTAFEALRLAKKQAAHPRVAYIHADINALPFPDEFFDFINCDQMIHHTADPRTAFENLRRKLKPGGHICCYVYKKKAVVREFTDDYVRERISRLPADEALRICESITRLGQALADLDVTLDVPEDIPVLGITQGKVSLQRFFHWNVMKCFWNDDFDFHTNNIINFDWYHPEFCFRFEPREFRSWFAKGWDIESWDVQDAGISCRARKV